MTATINEVRLLAGRSLRHIPRIPEKAFGAVFMPVVFVLMFTYVFGSAINIPGGDYHSYLVSGIFAQSMLGTLPGIAVGVATDIRSGLMDRLRTLPIARGSVIAGAHAGRTGRAVAPGWSSSRSCGLIVGWAPQGTVLETAAAFGLLLVMAFAFTWIGVWVGLMVRDPDGADGIVMSVIFPLMFLSGIFVPVAGLPDGLQQIATYNPVTALATAVRELFGSPTGNLPDVWVLQHPVITSLLWAAGLMAVFVPLAIRRYKRLGLLSAGEVQPELRRAHRGRRARRAGPCRRGSARGSPAAARPGPGSPGRTAAAPTTAPSRAPRRPGTRRRGPA